MASQKPLPGRRDSEAELAVYISESTCAESESPSQVFSGPSSTASETCSSASFPEDQDFESESEADERLGTTLTDKPGVPPLTEDVLDLRAASWTDQKPKKLEGPSTLEQWQKFRAETACADTGPFRRSATQRRCQSGFQVAPAQRWADMEDMDVDADLTLTQSVTHEKQSSFQGGWGGEPIQKIQTMPPVLSGSTGEEPVKRGTRQRWRNNRTQKRSVTASRTGDPIKDALVDKIKSLQRCGEVAKQAWGAFSESQEGKNRYPAEVER